MKGQEGKLHECLSDRLWFGFREVDMNEGLDEEAPTCNSDGMSCKEAEKRASSVSFFRSSYNLNVSHIIPFQPCLIDYEMDKEIMSEPPPCHIPPQIPPNLVALTSTIPPVPWNIPIDSQLLDIPLPASAIPEPDEVPVTPVQAPVDLPRLSNIILPTNSLAHQPITDDPSPDQREVFELFHDALELLVVDTDDDTLLTVTSTSTDEAADALYPRLRQLFATGKAEPLPPFSATSICNLDVKALDRTKISANM